MTTLLHDLRLGFRLFHRQPGFSLVAVLVLALGIGANTTIFGLVNALVLKPRAGSAESLVSVYSKDRAQPDTFRAFSYDNFADLRSRTEVFASLTAHNPAMVGISEGDATRRSFIDITTADLFDTFQVPLAMGRTFTREEERPGADIPVTILSHAAWKRLGSPEDAVGRTIRINQRDFTVIGVAPREFTGTIAMVSPDLWVPTGMYETVANDFGSDTLEGTNLSDRRHHALVLYGRLRDGVTMDEAAPLLAGASAWLEQVDPVVNKNQDLMLGELSRFGVSTSPTNDTQVSLVLFSLLGMSGIVLMIAALNLANMQMARAGSRRKEFAIRLAIGGSRMRLVRQLITEGLVLSTAAGLVAVLASWSAVRLLLTGLDGLLPVVMVIDPTPDWRVFAATMVFAVAATLVSGLGPALASSRTNVLPELKEQAGEMPVARSRVATRHVLVMGQLALSLALLTTAGAFLQGALKAATIDPGYSFEQGIFSNIDTGLAGFDQARTIATYGEVLERVRQVPGVTGAGFATQIAFGDIRESRRVQKAGQVITRSSPEFDTRTEVAITMGVSPGYFESLGLSLVRGRDFTDAEWRNSERTPVGIIDQALATKLFGADDPIGQFVQLSPADDGSVEVVEVVGLAPAMRHEMTDEVPGPHLYRPYAQVYRTGVYFHIQTANPSGEAALLPSLRTLLRGINDQLPILTLETASMYRERNSMLWIVRTGATLFGVFGAVALFMAALGIYGVKAFLVSRRTREIGIRLALGATARDVVSLVLRDGLTLTLVGLAVGVVLSYGAVVAIGSLLFGGGGFDLPIVAGAFLTLALASVGANLIPARRATRIAPTIALRSE